MLQFDQMINHYELEATYFTRKTFFSNFPQNPYLNYTQILHETI